MNTGGRRGRAVGPSGRRMFNFLQEKFPPKQPRQTPTTLAPTFTLVICAMVVAYIIRFSVPEEESRVVFATASNGGYLALALLCPSDDGALAVVLTGASSLAFHAQRDNTDYAHTLDTALAWVLVVHLAFSSLLSGARVFAFWWNITDDNPSYWLLRMFGRMAVYAVFGSVITVLFSFYHEIRLDRGSGMDGNCLVFVICGGVAAVALCVQRIFVLGSLARAARSGASPVGLAKANATLKGPFGPYAEGVIESTVILVCAVAGVSAQGDVIGRHLPMSFNTPEYDLYHGQWHILIALAAAAVYERVDDINRYARGGEPVCICHSQWPEIVMLISVGVYALLVVALKESYAEIYASQATLFVSALVLLGISGYAWWSSNRGRGSGVPLPYNRVPGPDAPTLRVEPTTDSKHRIRVVADIKDANEGRLRFAPAKLVPMSLAR